MVVLVAGAGAGAPMTGCVAVVAADATARAAASAVAGPVDEAPACDRRGTGSFCATTAGRGVAAVAIGAVCCSRGRPCGGAAASAAGTVCGIACGAPLTLTLTLGRDAPLPLPPSVPQDSFARLASGNVSAAAGSSWAGVSAAETAGPGAPASAGPSGTTVVGAAVAAVSSFAVGSGTSASFVAAFTAIMAGAAGRAEYFRRAPARHLGHLRKRARARTQGGALW